jgi:hypothetical protein
VRPFLNFYGGKWKLARRLGQPQHDHVIEAFAGSAGYSVYWCPPRVTLIEKDPTLVGIWQYLQRVSPQEVMAIPVEIDHVYELPPSVCQEARDLIGFWLNRGMSQPAKQRSQWARSEAYRHLFWGQQIRYRIASQLEKIRHWTIIHGDYTNAPDVTAHWHVDAPYQEAGEFYKHNDLDREALAEWCKRRRGFLQVCEANGADWMPFKPFTHVTTPRKNRFSAEALFERW